MQVTWEMIDYYREYYGDVQDSLQALFDKYVTPLENDRKRFESAYLELRDKLPGPPEGAVYRDVPFNHNEKYGATLCAQLRVWYNPDTLEVLRVGVLPRDPIAVEAERIAKLPGMTALFDGKTAPLEAIDRILREVRK